MAGDFKNMDRWLGDGGMPIIAQVGGSFDSYGVDGEDLGWVIGTFAPTALACNPHGIVQAGVHSLVLDAAINFAINSAMTGKDRTKATLELKTETMRPALLDERYVFRGDVVRMTRQVAFGEGVIRDAEGGIISRATATFLLHRDEVTTGSAQ
jgi:acyl-coenzyme A thioesterase PaaI-like protein